MLARLFVLGVDVDSLAHYPPGHRRVPLPTYPFQRVRCWLDESQEIAAVEETPALSALGVDADLLPWLHQPRWEPSPLDAGQVIGHPTAHDWILFTDSSEISVALQQRLQQAGARVTEVMRGPRFRQISANRYELHPARAEHYQRLLRKLLNAGRSIQIVHMWSIGHLGWSSDQGSLEAALDDSLTSTFWWRRPSRTGQATELLLSTSLHVKAMH